MQESNRNVMQWVRWTLLGLLAVALLYMVVVAFVEKGGAARRTQSLNNVKNIGFAAHEYARSHEGALPRGVLRDETGRELHGWPAQLLPGLDAEALRGIVDFTKPWDDPANRRAMEASLWVFRYPGIRETDDDGYALIHYAANARVIGDHDPLTLDDISAGDGLATTLLFGEVGGGFRPWGHPRNFRDPALALGQSATQFGSPKGSGEPVHVSLADGSSRAVNPTIDPAVLRALATPNGGEEVDPNWSW